jgi:hypothetical protein
MNNVTRFPAVVVVETVVVADGPFAFGRRRIPVALEMRLSEQRDTSLRDRFVQAGST